MWRMWRWLTLVGIVLVCVGCSATERVDDAQSVGTPESPEVVVKAAIAALNANDGATLQQRGPTPLPTITQASFETAQFNWQIYQRTPNPLSRMAMGMILSTRWSSSTTTATAAEMTQVTVENEHELGRIAWQFDLVQQRQQWVITSINARILEQRQP